jgi:hypothetical protein
MRSSRSWSARACTTSSAGWSTWQLTYALADLATIPRAALVVEDRYSSLFKLEHTKPSFITEMLAALTIRYPTVPIHFAETRPLAEEWTYRFLGAALAYAQAHAGPP